ncbi:hypothetical protein Rhow_008025 [Rhodococcus wratislaviensis]|uniref:Uncharacterized protein n=1 Tax=Rhodococcus wratislaviensis TaxID=44752 RepID=A0A402CJH4_RHOWR|nr:hypothetical protein Rhow_008025 [Rhodococcus wratislaviensis]
MHGVGAEGHSGAGHLLEHDRGELPARLPAAAELLQNLDAEDA